MSPWWKNRKPWILLGLSISFLLYAVPVTRSKNVKDPLFNHFSDHLRYRYCSLLVLEDPVRALTTPLGRQYSEDRTHKHRALNWANEPCHQGGALHVVIHAPFQLLLEWDVLAPHQVTTLYILLTLLVAHLCLGLILSSRRQWWVAFLLYFWLIRTSLSGLQSPIAFTLGWITTTRISQDRHLSGLGWFALTVSAYGRWIVWAPAVALRLALAARDVLTALRAALATWRGRVISALLAALFLWSSLAAVMVLATRVAPRLIQISPTIAPSITLVLATWAVIFALRWRNPLPQFALTISGFLFLYRDNDPLFWYGGPLYALFPLARGAGEAAALALASGVISEMVLRGPNLLHFNDIVVWLIKAWGGA